MKCALCGFEFKIKEAHPCCSRCGLVRKCELIRCPNCFYEMPIEPEWIKKLKERRRKKNDING